jgi:hypothetical protein
MDGKGASSSRAGKTKTRYATKRKLGRKVQAKRFLWSNDLHMRFLMAMFDWGLSKVDPKLVFESLNDVSGLEIEDVKEYLDVIKKAMQKSKMDIQRQTDERIKQDYATLPYTNPKGTVTNFTEYPIKMDFLRRIENKDKIIPPPLEPRSGRKSIESNASERPNGAKRKRSAQRQSPVRPGKHRKVRNGSGEDFADLSTDALLSPLLSFDGGGSLADFLEDEAGNTILPQSSEVIGSPLKSLPISYLLHREMMQRHTQNILRYGYHRDSRVISNSGATLMDDKGSIFSPPATPSLVSPRGFNPIQAAESTGELSEYDDDLFKFLLDED